MKNAVTFKNNEKGKEAFSRLSAKENVVSVHEPYNLIVFEDDVPVAMNTEKVSRQSVVKDAAINTSFAVLQPIDMKRATKWLSANRIETKETMPGAGLVFVVIPEGETYLAFRERLLASGQFLTVDRDSIIEAKKDTVVNDVYSYSSQWHLGKILAGESWALFPNDNTVIEVAVLDVGCDTSHEDLQGALSTMSYNAVTQTNDVNPASPYVKHGTPCAGIPAARTNNSIGCASIGFNRIRTQFINIGYNSSASGSFSTSDLILTRAVQKAIENPLCASISMSFGSSSYRTGFYNALVSARTSGRGGKGIICLGSAGNNGLTTWTNYPASYSGVVAVIASTSADTRAGFSNYGTAGSMAAPGTGIVTTDRTGADGYTTTGYTNFSGTSAACPVLAAVAAAVVLCKPSITEAELKNILFSTAMKVGNYTYTNGKSMELGYGRVNMLEAIRAATGLSSGVGVTGGTGTGVTGGTGGTVSPPVQRHNFRAAVTGPVSVNAGAGFSVQVTAITDNPTLGATSVQITTVWSTDASFSSSDPIIDTRNVTLGGGTGMVNFVLGYTAPAASYGNRYVISKIDPSNLRAESNENDNTYLHAMTVPAPVAATGAGLEAVIDSAKYDAATNKTVIRYRFRNTGTTVVTNAKIRKGFTEATSTTSSMNFSNPLQPGQLQTNTYYSLTVSNTPSLPATYTFRVLEVNGGLLSTPSVSQVIVQP